MNRFDYGLPLPVVMQRRACKFYVITQGRIRHRQSGPNGIKEGLSGNHPVPINNQIYNDIKDFWLNGNRHITVFDTVGVGIDFKIIHPVTHLPVPCLPPRCAYLLLRGLSINPFSVCKV